MSILEYGNSTRVLLLDFSRLKVLGAFLRSMEGIKIFYDGTDVAKWGCADIVQGFTTNTSFMKQGQKLNYTEFYGANKDVIGDRPISLQVWEEDPRQQARAISALGPNVWAKVPIVSSDGQPNLAVIEELRGEGLKLNVTAVFTKEQCKNLRRVLAANDTPVIVSIFAGRISDTGADPFPIVQYAVNLYSDLPYVEILWAGCKEVLSIRHAIRSGAQIITIPDTIISRLGRLDKNLTEFSVETARDFNSDGKSLNI